VADFGTTVAGLRAWIKHQPDYERAAVELLIWHETWLRRPDFTAAAVFRRDSAMVIDWRRARKFSLDARGASTSQMAIMDIAAALAENTFHLSSLGRVHKRKVAEAFAAACGWRLEGDIPETGHNHPDFIPGTPETCEACAREAKDEGKR
jgi:hypothetical protein